MTLHNSVICVRNPACIGALFFSVAPPHFMGVAIMASLTPESNSESNAGKYSLLRRLIKPCEAVSEITNQPSFLAISWVLFSIAVFPTPRGPVYIVALHGDQ